MTVVEYEHWVFWYCQLGSLYDDNYFKGKEHHWYDLAYEDRVIIQDAVEEILDDCGRV